MEVRLLKTFSNFFFDYSDLQIVFLIDYLQQPFPDDKSWQKMADVVKI